MEVSRTSVEEFADELLTLGVDCNDFKTPHKGQFTTTLEAGFEHTRNRTDGCVLSGELRKAYVNFCSARGLMPKSHKKLVMELRRLGWKRDRTNAGRLLVSWTRDSR